MIEIPYETILEKIENSASLKKEEIEKKIEEKLEQLHGLISKQGAAHIIATELGIKLFEQSKKSKIKDIYPGMKGVNAIGVVTNIFPIREFQTEKASGKVGSFVIRDETASTRVVLWNDQTKILEKIKESDIVQVENAYVKENNNRTELHCNERSSFSINPQGIKINIRTVPTRKKLAELQDQDSAEILGTVVDIFPPRFFEVCECGRRVQQQGNEFVCVQHGTTKPIISYVTNIILDDGSDNMRIVLWKKQSEDFFSFINKTPEQTKDIPIQELKQEILGMQIKITGQCKNNLAFDRKEFVATTIHQANPKEEIK